MQKKHPPVSTLPKPTNESEVLIDHGSTNIFRGTNGFPKIPTTQLLLGCCCCCCCFFFRGPFSLSFRVLETIRVDFFWGERIDLFLLDGSDILLFLPSFFFCVFFWGGGIAEVGPLQSQGFGEGEISLPNRGTLKHLWGQKVEHLSWLFLKIRKQHQKTYSMECLKKNPGARMKYYWLQTVLFVASA